MTGPRRFHHSGLQLLRLCAFAYEQREVLHRPGTAAPALVGGGNVHRAVNLALRRLIETGAVDVHEVAFRTVQGGGVEYADALEVLIRFQEALGIEFDVDPDQVLFLEETLEMPIELPSGEVVVFHGTPDLVERTAPAAVRIPDWKTHWVPETQQQFELDEQLPRYALLVHHRFPAVQRFELVKRFVRWRDNAPSMTITVDDLPAIRARLVTEIVYAREMEEAGVWRPTGGGWCAVCDQTHRCPLVTAYRTGRDVSPLALEDDQEAQTIAGDALALDAAAAAQKDRLKRYLGGTHKRGAVAVAGGSYGYGPVNHRSIDERALRSILEEAGIEIPARLFAVNMDQLDRLLRRVPEDVARAVESATRRWQSTECRFRRAAPTRPPSRPPVTPTQEGDLL